jgi:hypothetical protein
MERPMNHQSLGDELGTLGAVRTEEIAAQCSTHEKRVIELSNLPQVLVLRTYLGLLRDEENGLVARLCHAEPLRDVRRRRRALLYYWGVTLILAAAGFLFSLMSFEPFRLGWKAVVVCLGIAILVPFSMERLLSPEQGKEKEKEKEKERIIKILAGVAFTAALVSGVLLATVRGNLMVHAIRSAEPAVVIEGEATEPQPASDPFYEQTLGLMCTVLALVAIGMELCAGLALREARRLGDASREDPVALSKELARVRQAMIATLLELSTLENEPEQYEESFWRDYYRSLLTRSIRQAIKKLMIVTLLATVLVPARAHAENNLNLVVLVDLSKSVDLKGPNGKTPYEENLEAVSRLLSQVPAGAKITVVGITSDSFAQPDILLSAQIGTDEGYFKEKLASAHNQLVRAWQKRCQQLEHDFPHTDILGALMLANQLFEQGGGDRKVLVIFSDMRQSTNVLNLESSKALSRAAVLTKVRRDRILTVLENVEVHVLGADNLEKDLAYWNHLREFWLWHFKKGGATAKSYSALPDLPQF